jgi:hypothetical protein
MRNQNEYTRTIFKAAEDYVAGPDRKYIKELYTVLGIVGPQAGRKKYHEVRGYVSDFTKIAPLAAASRDAGMLCDVLDVIARYVRAVKCERESLRESQPHHNRLKNLLSGHYNTDSSQYVRKFARMTATAWKNNLCANFTGKIVMHSMFVGWNQSGTICSTPTIAKKRVLAAEYKKDDPRHVPIVATDRFIIKCINPETGLAYVPDRIEEEHPVKVRFLYVEDSKIKAGGGYLIRYGNEFGCAHTEKDALKSAKMQATRAARKALGVL